MNIFKYLLPWITLLFFIVTGVHANDSDKKKNYDKDGKKYHQKKWDKKGKMMWGKKRKQGGSFAMIEAQGKLFLYNKKQEMSGCVMPLKKPANNWLSKIKI